MKPSPETPFETDTQPLKGAPTDPTERERQIAQAARNALAARGGHLFAGTATN